MWQCNSASRQIRQRAAAQQHLQLVPLMWAVSCEHSSAWLGNEAACSCSAGPNLKGPSSWPAPPGNILLHMIGHCGSLQLLSGAVTPHSPARSPSGRPGLKQPSAWRGLPAAQMFTWACCAMHIVMHSLQTALQRAMHMGIAKPASTAV